MSAPIASITCHRARISPKTEWIFVRAATADGLVSWGEGTLSGREGAVAAAVAGLAASLTGAVPQPGVRRAGAADDLARWAAASAVDMALCDVAARARGKPAAALLGGVRTAQIPVYANINRRTVERSPAGFAASARLALAAGHQRFKLAPFDGLTPALSMTGEGRPLVEAGLARIAAVRAAVGTLPVMVDCHWRFAADAVPALVGALAEHAVSWLECPIPEDGGSPPVLARLRAQANARGMALAGCETQTTPESFAAFLDAGAYDVVMPDVKYVGTLDAMLRIGELAERARARSAPHNPSGPIAHAASLHVCAASGGEPLLELQFDESPLFDELVGGPFAPVAHGAIAALAAPGLSVAIDEATLARLAPAGAAQ